MTLKKVKQIYDLCMKLPDVPRALSQINALTDQALINVTYETDKTAQEAQDCLLLISGMISKYRFILGR